MSLKKIGDKIAGVAPKREKKSKKEKRKKKESIENGGDVVLSSSGEVVQAEGRRARVLFDYEPEQDDEIALTPGDVILVYDQDESGWWTGEIGEQYGLFPGAFVEFLDANEEENYDFLKSTGDAEEERVIQELIKPERTMSSSKVASASSDADVLRTKLAASEESRAALQVQVDQLKAAAAIVPLQPSVSTSQEIDSLRQHLGAQSEEIASLRAERDRLASSLAQDGAELNMLRKARAEAEGTSAILRRNVDAAQAEVAKARTERDAANERLKGAQESKTSSNSNDSELQLQNKALERSNMQLAQDLSQAKVKLAAALSAVSAVPAAAPSLEKSVNEQRLEAQVRDLKAQLATEHEGRQRAESRAGAGVRVTSERRPPPASPKPGHLPVSQSAQLSPTVPRASPVAAGGSHTSERPSIPPRRSVAIQPVNPEQEAEDWQVKKLKATGLLAQLP